MSDIVESALLALIIGAASLQVQKRERRWWVRPWIRKRNSRGNCSLVHDELEADSFKNYLRMDKPTFEFLLSRIEKDISKQDTMFRSDRLTIVLRYLANGGSYADYKYNFRIGHSTLSVMIPEVCRAIYCNLKADYLRVPKTTAEWLNIAKVFEDRWNLPNILGAMDGKHIQIQARDSEGSKYFNYKGTHSIVLLALVDANYKFLYADIGANGRMSDGGVFAQSNLAAAIEANTLNFPEDQALPGREKPIPFVITADAAFPLSEHILKPFPFRNMTLEQRILNYRISRVRRVVENAFGILANRFRILLNVINLEPKKAQLITQACVVLHNFLMTECPRKYSINEVDIDRRYTFKYGLTKQAGNRSKLSALNNRIEFMEYVNDAGAVPWQNNFA